MLERLTVRGVELASAIGVSTVTTSAVAVAHLMDWNVFLTGIVTAIITASISGAALIIVTVYIRRGQEAITRSQESLHILVDGQQTKLNELIRAAVKEAAETTAENVRLRDAAEREARAAADIRMRLMETNAERVTAERKLGEANVKTALAEGEHKGVVAELTRKAEDPVTNAKVDEPTAGSTEDKK